MPVLGSHFKDIVDRYRGPEGDVFALEELAPVAARFLDADSKVLEVGCGYGRNLMALASLKPRIVVGSDVDAGELQRSAVKRATLPADKFARIELVQQEPRRLPFRDGVFDMVVLWQVLEHVIGQELKQTLVSECIRVLKPGGVVLVETPNQWFPVDYHDNKLPLVHWLLPFPAREWLTHRVRGMRYHPSEYVYLGSCERLLKNAPNVRAVHKETGILRALVRRGVAHARRHPGGRQARDLRARLAVPSGRPALGRQRRQHPAVIARRVEGREVEVIVPL